MGLTSYDRGSNDLGLGMDMEDTVGLGQGHGSTDSGGVGGGIGRLFVFELAA